MGVTGLPSVAITDSTADGRTLLTDADAPAQRTSLELGSGALVDTGTSAGNAIELDGSARLPAVDGSQLTGLSGGPTIKHSIQATPTSLYLLPRFDQTSGVSAQVNGFVYAAPLVHDYDLPITDVGVNVINSAVGGSVTLAIAEDWIDGSGASRPGAIIGQGTVVGSSAGVKTLTFGSHTILEGVRYWLVCWSLQAIQLRAANNSVYHQLTVQYWGFNTTTYYSGLVSTAAQNPFPTDLTALSWNLTTLMPVMGVR